MRANPELSEKYGFKQEGGIGVIEVIEPCLDYGGALSGYLGKKVSATYDLHLFNHATHFTEGQYQGGQWGMVRLNNGSFFLCWDTDLEEVNLVNNNNYTNEKTSVSAMCLAIQIGLINNFGWALHSKKHPDANRLFDLYHMLRYAACEHKDAAAILGFID